MSKGKPIDVRGACASILVEQNRLEREIARLQTELKAVGEALSQDKVDLKALAARCKKALKAGDE